MNEFVRGTFSTVSLKDNDTVIKKIDSDRNIICYISELAVLTRGLKDCRYMISHSFTENDLTMKLRRFEQLGSNVDSNALTKYLLGQCIVLYNDGWLHGDIKRANIMKYKGAFQLIDYGISICHDQSVFSRPIHTIPHRSPELLLCQFDKEYALSFQHSLKSELWAIGMVVMSLFCNVNCLFSKSGYIFNPNTIETTQVNDFIFLLNCMDHLLNVEARTLKEMDTDMIQAWNRITVKHNVKKIKNENLLSVFTRQFSEDLFLKCLVVDSKSRLTLDDSRLKSLNLPPIIPWYTRLHNKRLFFRKKLPDERYFNTVDCIYQHFLEYDKGDVGYLTPKIIYCIYLATYYQTVIADFLPIDLRTLTLACIYICEAVCGYSYYTALEHALTNKIQVYDRQNLYNLIDDIISSTGGNINFTTPYNYKCSSNKILRDLIFSSCSVYDDVELAGNRFYEHSRRLDTI